ncbi:MAG: hypothetical protein ACI9DH_000539, partial [Halioglobus sp.]
MRQGAEFKTRRPPHFFELLSICAFRGIPTGYFEQTLSMMSVTVRYKKA